MTQHWRVSHLVGLFHCCPFFFLSSFPRHLSCLFQRAFWCLLITSLPLFLIHQLSWWGEQSMGLVSFASLYSAFIFLNNRASVKKNSKANNVSPSDVNLPKVHSTWCHHRLPIHSAVTDYSWFYSWLPQSSQDLRKGHYIKGLLIIYAIDKLSALFGSSFAQFSFQAIDLFLGFPIIQPSFIYEQTIPFKV